MDGVDRKIEADKKIARKALIVAATPGGPVRCDCGGPLVRPEEPWITSFRLRQYARGNLSSGVVHLALYDLMDEGYFEENPKTLKLRLKSKHWHKGGTS